MFPVSERDFTVPSFYMFYGWSTCSRETFHSLYMENPEKVRFPKEHNNLIENKVPAICHRYTCPRPDTKLVIKC